MFKVRNSILMAKLSTKTSLHIFDTLVKPINTYGADIWGAFLNNTDKMFNVLNDKYLFDNFSFEKTDLQFCKSLLGVHRKASNVAVRGELGRYPVTIYILKQVMKNWLRIAEHDKDSLLYDVYLCNVQLLFNNKKCWLQKIHSIVYQNLGFNHMWDNQGMGLKLKGHVLKAVANLKHIFEFQWRNELNKFSNSKGKAGSKLKRYSLFKNNLVFEKSLEFERDFRKRNLITKLVISAHRLEVQTGRYNKMSTVRTKLEDRTCKLCNSNSVEDALLGYQKYSTCRDL
jgi:hypothetical protein